MGGTDDPSNLIDLTVEEHAQAHYELWEKYGKNEDLLAYKGLLKLVSKDDIIKELCSRKGKDNPMYGKFGEFSPNYGKKRTEESKRKISSALKEYAKNRNPEHEKKLKESLYNEETNKKRANNIARKWEVISPDGKVKVVHNIAKWCEENGFNRSSVSCAAKNGNLHKNYLFRKLG